VPEGSWVCPRCAPAGSAPGVGAGAGAGAGPAGAGAGAGAPHGEHAQSAAAIAARKRERALASSGSDFFGNQRRVLASDAPPVPPACDAALAAPTTAIDESLARVVLHSVVAAIPLASADDGSVVLVTGSGNLVLPSTALACAVGDCVAFWDMAAGAEGLAAVTAVRPAAATAAALFDSGLPGGSGSGAAGAGAGADGAGFLGDPVASSSSTSSSFSSSSSAAAAAAAAASAAAAAVASGPDAGASGSSQPVLCVVAVNAAACTATDLLAPVGELLDAFANSSAALARPGGGGGGGGAGSFATRLIIVCESVPTFERAQRTVLALQRRCLVLDFSNLEADPAAPRRFLREQAGAAGAARGTQQGTRFVLMSVTRNHLQVLEKLAEGVTDACPTLAFDKLLRACSDAMVASSEATLRAYLDELADHDIVRLDRKRSNLVTLCVAKADLAAHIAEVQRSFAAR